MPIQALEKLSNFPKTPLKFQQLTSLHQFGSKLYWQRLVGSFLVHYHKQLIYNALQTSF